MEEPYKLRKHLKLRANWRKLLGLVALVMLIIYEFRPLDYEGLMCVDEKAATLGHGNFHYDGYFVGANGCLYDPHQLSLEQVPPVITGKLEVHQPLVYVNGAEHRVKWSLAEIYLLAHDLKAPVIGVYNGTLGGRIPDFFLRGLFPGRVNSTLHQVLMEALTQHKPLWLRANSQGAAELAQALYVVRHQLEQVLPAARVDQIMSLFQVETAGSASSDFPDGPRYIHYVNIQDPVSQYLGMLKAASHPGRGAVIACFDAKDTAPIELRFRWIDPLTRHFFLDVHGFMIYRHYRRPFGELYKFSRADGQAAFVHIAQPTDSVAGAAKLSEANSCG
jgi:hypothetical protein